MGNCKSNESAHYIYNNIPYQNYCKDCKMHYSPKFTREQHCCKCKMNYDSHDKHCCYCKKVYHDWHICECKNCTLRSTKYITKNMQHTICKNCNEQCSYNHNCSNNSIKKQEIMGIMVSEPIVCKLEIGECNICCQKTEIKKLKCCNETKNICKECYQKIKKCCPFCTKNISII